MYLQKAVQVTLISAIIVICRDARYLLVSIENGNGEGLDKIGKHLHKMEGNCAERNIQSQCDKVNDRRTCLKSIETRTEMVDGIEIRGSDCGWCVNGPCTGDNKSRCAPSNWLIKLGISFEKCSEGCRKGQFMCGNGRCIDAFSVNDGRKDCEDGSDEKVPATVLPRTTEYTSEYTSEYIPESTYTTAAPLTSPEPCDSHFDCPYVNSVCHDGFCQIISTTTETTTDATEYTSTSPTTSSEITRGCCQGKGVPNGCLGLCVGEEIHNARPGENYGLCKGWMPMISECNRGSQQRCCEKKGVPSICIDICRGGCEESSWETFNTVCEKHLYTAKECCETD